MKKGLYRLDCRYSSWRFYLNEELYSGASLDIVKSEIFIFLFSKHPSRKNCFKFKVFGRKEEFLWTIFNDEELKKRLIYI